MKFGRSLLAACLMLAIAAPVFAEEAKTAKSPEDMAKEALAKWKDTLKITDEQAPKFEAAMTESYQKMAEAKTAAAGDKAKMKESMGQIMKDRDAALSQILTPEQMKTYHSKMGSMHKKAEKKMKSSEKSEKSEHSEGSSGK